MSAKFPRGGGGAGPFLARSLDGLVLKLVIYGVFFYHFPLILKVFMNIHEYAN